MLKAYAYRLFWENDDKPRKIRLEDIRSVFPPSVYPESVLKKRLKHCAEFKKIGSEQTYLVNYIENLGISFSQIKTCIPDKT